jgi:transposase InsO family protein
MRREGIVGHRPRRRRSLTRRDEAAAPAPDLLGRLFDPDRPDVAWCGDITYIRTDEGWLYLASVIDLASRQLLGWSMGDRHDARLACDALHAAVAARGRRRMDGVIMHTDRGAEYTSAAFTQACAQLGARRSMSRTGSCLDNAVAESFFATLKVELVNRRGVHHPRPGADGDLRLDRLVQPPSAALVQQLPTTRRVGTPTRTHQLDSITDGRITTVSGPRGKSIAAPV